MTILVNPEDIVLSKLENRTGKNTVWVHLCMNALNSQINTLKGALLLDKH